jgi:hypothetical protein
MQKLTVWRVDEYDMHLKCTCSRSRKQCSGMAVWYRVRYDTIRYDRVTRRRWPPPAKCMPARTHAKDRRGANRWRDDQQIHRHGCPVDHLSSVEFSHVVAGRPGRGAGVVVGWNRNRGRRPMQCNTTCAGRARGPQLS